MAQTSPFSRFEFMIAWRYLRAKRAEGGVSVMTWISLIGITLGVLTTFALMPETVPSPWRYIWLLLGGGVGAGLGWLVRWYLDRRDRP